MVNVQAHVHLSMWLFVWMKYVRDHILSMYHIMGLWWGIVHVSLYLFIHCNLVMQGFSLGGETLKTAFSSSVFVARIFFLWINLVAWS